MNKRAGRRIGLLAVFLCLQAGCRTAPVPPEVAEADRLEQSLERTGASLLFADEVAGFRRRLADLKLRTARERAKLGWFRDFGPAADEGRRLVALGRGLLADVDASRETRASRLRDEAGALRVRIGRLQAMTRFFNEDDAVRKSVSQAEIKLGEMGLLLEGGKSEDAAGPIREAGGFVQEAEREVRRLLERYRDPEELKTWKRWADETVADSRIRGVTAIVVSKLERKLTVYKRGVAVAVYEIGLGKYGLSDKLYAGDEATPEGRYRVVRRFVDPTLYKSLLIDYPNPDDLRAFAEARKKGLVPRGSTAGGAIEIHGNGKGKLTQGCVGLENKDMDEIFAVAGIGTPVTIVGTRAVEGTILAETEKFEIP